MTADDIIIALTPSGPVPAWVHQAALLMYPNKYSKTYDTTAVNFFPETTVRLPQDGQTRRGKPRFQRRRLDLVALVQPHYRQWQPFVAGVEIKVDTRDLAGDHKMEQYLEFCHLFYLAAPASLGLQAAQKIDSTPALTGCGLLLIGNGDRVHVQRWPSPRRPTNRQLASLYAELLIRPFKLPQNKCKNFYQFHKNQD